MRRKDLVAFDDRDAWLKRLFTAGGCQVHTAVGSRAASGRVTAGRRQVRRGSSSFSRSTLRDGAASPIVSAKGDPNRITLCWGRRHGFFGFDGCDVDRRLLGTTGESGDGGLVRDVDLLPTQAG
jgi:hypothetical protein